MTNPAWQLQSLLEDLDDDRGEMSTDSVLVFHEQETLTRAGQLGYVTYRTYANGEHVCMTDEGYAALENATIAYDLEKEAKAQAARAAAEKNARINLSLSVSISHHPYAWHNIMLDDALGRYNPAIDYDTLCKCGHTYDRHFDPYEDWAPVGCKYCRCYDFQPQHPLEQKKFQCR